MQPSPPPRNSFDTADKFWLAAAAALSALWPLSYFAFRVRTQMILSEDFAQQFALLSWIHRAVFERAGPIVSPPYFFPEQGILSVSETPILPGLLFGLLRTLGAGAVLSWNLCLATGYAAGAAALYLCARGERIGRAGALLAAIYYGTGIWTGLVGDGIHYRWAFGPPLAWYLLRRIEEGAPLRREAMLLGLVVLLQYDACATNALTTLFVIGVGVAVSPGLWRPRAISTVAASLAPTALLGAFWARTTRGHLEALGHSPTLDGTAGQVYHRFDLANFLPLPKGALAAVPKNWAQMPALAEVSLLPPVLLIAAAVAGALLLGRDRQGEGTPSSPPAESPRPGRAWIVVAALGAAAFAAAAYRLKGVFPEFGSAPFLWLLTAAAWAGACRLWEKHRIRAAGDLEVPPAVGRYWALLAAGIWIGMGPIVFLWGTPVLLGPLSVLDPVFPFLQRARVSANFLGVASLGLSLAAAAGIEQLLVRARIPGRLALLATLLLGAAALLPALLGLGHFPLRTAALPAEACPKCAKEGIGIIGEPYRFILESGEEGPLFELPAGYGNLNFPGESPASGHDAAYMFYYALDGLTRLNGSASFYSKGYRALLEAVNDFPSAGSINAMRLRGAEWLVVHGDRYPPEEWKRLQERLSADPPLLELAAKWGPVWLYRVKPLAMPDSIGLPSP